VEFPDGESLKEVQERALAAVERLAEDPENEVAVVVTHRVVLKALVLGLLRKNLKEFWKVRFANGSVTELELEEGKWKPVRFNDVEHLEGVGTLKDDF
jgi:broad specificity phosphatase PhoE